MDYPSIMNESEKGSSVSVPSAPPQPPNPSSEIDHSYHWTATGVPVHMTNQSNPPPRPAANPDLKSHPESPVPWSTGLFNCCDDVNSCKYIFFHSLITWSSIVPHFHDTIYIYIYINWSQYFEINNQQLFISYHCIIYYCHSNPIK